MHRLLAIALAGIFGIVATLAFAQTARAGAQRGMEGKDPCDLESVPHAC